MSDTKPFLVAIDALARSLERTLAAAIAETASPMTGAATVPRRLRLAALRAEMSPEVLLPLSRAAFDAAELAVRIAVRTRRSDLDRAAHGARLRLRLAPPPGRWHRAAAVLRRRLPWHQAPVAGLLEIRVRAAGAALVLINGRRLRADKAKES